MPEKRKTKRELLEELNALRRRVTQLKQSQKASGTSAQVAQDSEHKHGTLFANIPGMVFRAKADWSVDLVSNSESICGYLPQEFYLQQVNWLDIIHPEDREAVLNEGAELAQAGGTIVQKYRIITKGGDVRRVEDHKASSFTEEGHLTGICGVVFDVTDHKKPGKRQALRFQILESLDGQGSLEEVCSLMVTLVKGYLDCEAVALRMRDGDDYPYLVNNGFPREFIESENHLCVHDEEGECVRDAQGRPALACMCGSVINVEFDRNLPFHTERGSFWTNSTTELLASTTAETRGRQARNVCNQYGYESVALVPIRSDGDSKGLLQINAKRRNLFGPGEIRFLEELGHLIAIAVERKRTEDELRESETRLSIIFQEATEGIVVIDSRNGGFIDFNKAAHEHLGYTRDEFRKLTIADIEVVESAENVQEHIQRIRKRGSDAFETEHRTKDGGTRDTFVSTGASVVNERDCVIGIWNDVTESKRHERELASYASRMVRAEHLASVGTVGATVAHELTQPLMVIRLSIENALEDLAKVSCLSNNRDLLEDSLVEISRVVSIIDKLRNFARESAKGDIARVNIKDVCKRVAQLLDEQAWRAKLAVCFEEMDKLPSIFINKGDMEQLFFALIQNALQAADGKKARKLTISGAVENDNIELRFSDNCCGIAPEDLDKVFEPFFTTKPVGQGTGLGLCVVEHIVSSADGKIRVESKAGEGSTFLVTLPIKAGRRLH